MNIKFLKINNKMCTYNVEIVGRPRVHHKFVNASGFYRNHNILIQSLTARVDSGAFASGTSKPYRYTRGRLSILHSPINKFVVLLPLRLFTYAFLARHANEKSMLHLSMDVVNFVFVFLVGAKTKLFGLNI